MRPLAPLVALIALLAMAGCGCEDRVTLLASSNELDRTDRRLTELQFAITSLEVALASEGPGELFARASAIRQGLRECLMTARWSKNVDLVADNPRIIRKRDRVAKKLGETDRRFDAVMAEMTRRKIAVPPPAPEPAAEPPAPEAAPEGATEPAPAEGSEPAADAPPAPREPVYPDF